MLTNKLMGAAGGADEVYIEDVFSTYLYTGTGSTQTITNGIALADGVNIPIGTALAGGYFGGFISTSGTGVATHALIVAPKATGGNSSKQWKTTYTSTPGTSSLIDGPANSAAMNDASHPAAQFCEGLTIWGYSDWYLPAKNELEVLYYFLKPTTDANVLMPSSGSNANAVSPEPISTNYTAGSPAQTSAAAFQSGGAEAFAAGYYWSSTENSAAYAWIQDFLNGAQGYTDKNLSRYVRAVRRVAIADAILDPYRVSGKGGMVWLKSRVNSGPSSYYYNHWVVDTQRGLGQVGTQGYLHTNTGDPTNAAGNLQNVTISSFSSSGFTVGQNLSFSGQPYSTWTFRKAPKFFDVVTYTGNGSTQTINHNLGQAPGMIIVKCISNYGNWYVFHRSFQNTSFMVLNTVGTVYTGRDEWNSTTPTSSMFSVKGSLGTTNNSGATYVAYLFAHDTSTDGLIQCGSYTGNGSASGPTVSLGWEPQWLMIKNADGTGNWQIIDNMRGMPVGSADATLQANLSNAESSVDYVSPTATGFQVTSTSDEVNASSNTYIYMAIRRGPMRTPTDGTKVFSPVAYTGNSTGATKQTLATGFPPDNTIIRSSRPNTKDITVYDRLRGNGRRLITNLTNAEVVNTAFMNFTDNMQVVVGPDPEENPGYVNGNCIAWNFRRAPGFFDVVCYNGASSAQTIPHNLGVAPELIFVKNRTWGVYWAVYSATIGPTKFLQLNSAGGPAIDPVWNNTAPTSSVFSVREYSETGGSSDKYVAYLFASCPGVSKVGSYTGTGAAQTIDCGFTAGARFVLIKRTDSTGGWYTWDSARGIVSGNDPYLLMNSTAAEVTTTDYIDPYAAGFEISSTAPAEINASGGTFIYLAIA